MFPLKYRNMRGKIIWQLNENKRIKILFFLTSLIAYFEDCKVSDTNVLLDQTSYTCKHIGFHYWISSATFSSRVIITFTVISIFLTVSMESSRIINNMQKKRTWVGNMIASFHCFLWEIILKGPSKIVLRRYDPLFVDQRKWKCNYSNVGNTINKILRIIQHQPRTTSSCQ